MQTYFQQLTHTLRQHISDSERFTCWLSAEKTDFVRFNRSVIRQPGHVVQIVMRLQLLQGQTHVSSSLNLSGEIEQDCNSLSETLNMLREQIGDLPADPHLLIASDVNNSSHIQSSSLPDAEQMVADILEASTGLDMVGILTTGTQYRGFANSYGQQNWFESRNVNFDWSLFHAGDKAVKSNYAGFSWDKSQFQQKFDEAKQQLALLALPAISIPPGSYRAYLTPTALNELLMMLNWGGLSEKSLRTHQSCLRRLQAGEVSLHPDVHLSEDSLAGLEPVFQAQGFIKPEQIKLIDAGKLVGSMISPRSAKEYGVQSNGADGAESAKSLRMQAGNLAMKDALKQLGTGIYISNLWYLNFSDRANCRITGMTRFASFWVENGEIKAPLNVMRFDESLFRMLGEDLLALTKETETIMDDRSYGERHTGGAILPGALLKSMRFVL
ncbi:TldE/PmbA family protein [Undibacterium jejuense]|uniref:TldE/PmbA family protein n=1 Tax=Undibacterium jejuense TaxID=1344949 RepID=A0A923HGH5_9BURK|nr:metallopeptidase TldD-related protein [Undibacterium jejuense]MBC3864097.1 TldE/PmbA family protein [Undibacterium jejuense]